MPTTDVIYKYDVSPTFDLLLPAGARPLCVQVQNGVPVMWVLQNRSTTVPAETRRFACVGTGHSFDAETVAYVDTFQQPQLGLVWHVFEVKRG